MILPSNNNGRHLHWTVIVVTASDQESAYAFDSGLNIWI